MDISFAQAIKLVTFSLSNIPENEITQEIEISKKYLLKMINFDCSKITDNHLLIVIEGLDGTGKTSTAKEVVKILNERHSIKTEYVNSPPKSIRPLRAWFDGQDIDTRISYYIIGNFIAAKEFLLSDSKILVADRYWPSILAYREAEKDSDPKGRVNEKSCYKWPSYLPKPHKAGFIFLSIDETERYKRLKNKANLNNTSLTQLQVKMEHDDIFRNRILQIYKSISEEWNKEWSNSSVEINAMKPFNAVVEETINKIVECYHAQ